MSDTQCPGLRSLYHAAKLRQLRAIAADPNSAPARVAQANEEIRKLADSLYRDREVGPTALITRLEREGIEAVERTVAGRKYAPGNEALLKACRAAVAATKDEADVANLPPHVLDEMEWAIYEAETGGGQ